jgi:hypothetical protein
MQNGPTCPGSPLQPSSYEQPASRSPLLKKILRSGAASDHLSQGIPFSPETKVHPTHASDTSEPSTVAAPFSPVPKMHSFDIPTIDFPHLVHQIFSKRGIIDHLFSRRRLVDHSGFLRERMKHDDFNPLEAYEYLINLQPEYRTILGDKVFCELLCEANVMFINLCDSHNLSAQYLLGDYWLYQLHQQCKGYRRANIDECYKIDVDCQSSEEEANQTTAILKDWHRSPVYLRHEDEWRNSKPSLVLGYEYIDIFLACITSPEIRRRVAYFVTQEGLFGLVRPWSVEVSTISGYVLVQSPKSSAIFLEVLPNGNIRLCLQIFQSHVTLGKLILPIKSPLPLVLMFEMCGKKGNIIFSKAHVMANDLLIEREHKGQMILQAMPELLKIIKSIW